MKNTINFHLISKSTGQFQLMQHKFIVLNFHFTNVSCNKCSAIELWQNVQEFNII